MKNKVKNGRPRKFTSHWRPIVGSSILLISCAQLVCSSCLPSSSRLLILFPISSAHCCCTSRLLIPSGHLVCPSLVCSYPILSSSAHPVYSSRFRNSSAHLVGWSRQFISSDHLVCSSCPLISSAQLVCSARRRVSSAHQVHSSHLHSSSANFICSARRLESSPHVSC